MTDAEIYAEMNSIFQDLFADDSISLTPATKAEDVEGWDSFNHLNIIVAVESRFDIRLDSEEIDSLTNVGDLVAKVKEKRGWA